MTTRLMYPGAIPARVVAVNGVPTDEPVRATTEGVLTREMVQKLLADLDDRFVDPDLVGRLLDDEPRPRPSNHWTPHNTYLHFSEDWLGTGFTRPQRFVYITDV